ncbi:ABC transporter permease [Engelhardtia mirabilis]|uniref:ABC transporter permease YtrF n=1 Tax=Engelhardtia mirabilis TaxID=2528011 RepID=A0A518BHQ0_9BACT|nr:ABC transporter permease YtrF precursor [Planctomycetes bacterium Pla133]QDV00838.1 ABC transporter permease YtrF precursor [Planctomycetes bacterium Pla86]
MGLSLTVARGSLRRRPGRAIFSVLGVAMGIATVVAIFTVDFNTIAHSQRPQGDAGWKADLEVQARAGVDDAGTRLATMPGVRGSTAVLRAEGRLVTADDLADGQWRGAAVQVLAVESATAAAMGVYRLETGEGLPLDPEARGMLLGRRAAERAGLAPGDQVFLSRPPRAPKKVCIEGQVIERQAEGPAPRPMRFTVTGILAYEQLGRTANGDVAVIDLVNGQNVFEGVFVQPSFWIARDPEVDLERLQQGLGEDFAYDLRQGAAVGQAADERAFRNGVRLSGLMALALGLFVIFHTLSMSLVERLKEVATLHALGTSRARIGRAFFLEALLIAGFAGALGLFGGLLLAREMLEHGITSLGITHTVAGQFIVPWTQVLPLVALGVAMALLGSVFPLLRAGRADTVTALRGEESGTGHGVARGFHLFAALLLVGVLPITFLSVVDLVGESSRELVGVILLGVGVLALLVGTPLVVPSLMGRISRWVAEPFRRAAPFAGLLAGRAIERGPTRVAASVAAVALVTAAFVGLRGMTHSLYLETDVWATEAAVDKVWVSGLPGGTSWRKVASELEQYLGVVGVEVGTHRLSAPFRILGVDPEQVRRYGPLAKDSSLVAALGEARGMIVSRRLAKQRGLEVGDQVPVATPDSGVVTFDVIAVTDAYGYHPDPHERAYGLIANRHVERYFCVDTEVADRIAVRLEAGTDPLVVETALAGFMADGRELGFRSGREIRAVELADINRDFLVFDVILLLTAVLAGLGVLNGQLLAATERAKELGVLRALGASAGQIAGSVMLESTVIGAVGGVLGTVLGSGLVPVIVRALRVLSGLDLPQAGPGLAVLAAPVAALLVTWLAALYPIWRMGRMDPVEAVRTG